MERMLMFSPLEWFQMGPETAVVLEETNFFICVVAGVILALGFQLLLTALSIAGGMTGIGNLRKKAHQPDSQSAHQTHQDDEDGMNLGQKVSSGLGAWTLITTSIALFFASMLAVKLGLIGVNFIGATLGLVIWAAFFMIITYFEMNMVSSLVGGLVSTAKQGLSSATSVFSESEKGASKDVARTRAKEEAKEMRKQFEKLFSTHDVDKKVEDYVQQLKPQQIDIKQVKKQIKDLLTDIQVREKADFDYPHSVKKMILEEADNSTLSKENKQAIKDHVNSLKDIAQSDAPPQEKAKAGIEDLTPADREQIEQYQERIKKALEKSGKQELKPEQLEEDLRTIFNEPGSTKDIVKEKASALDRDTLVNILSSQNMSREEAEKRVSQAEKVLNKVRTALDQTSGKANSKKGDIQAQVRSLFSGANTPLNLDRIYADFTSIFQESAAGPDLKYKLKHYDRNQMTALITNRTSLSREEAESVADKIVSARDQVLSKAEEVEAKVNQKMMEVKEKTLKAAEESRKAAVTAAWWLVATAIFSAAASVFGGMLALEASF